MDKNKKSESVGIYLEGVKNVTIEGNKITGFDKAIAGKNVEDIRMIDNVLLEHNPTTPEELAMYLLQEKAFVQLLEEAKKGKKGAREYFKTILSSSTAAITTLAIKSLLKRYGIDL